MTCTRFVRNIRHSVLDSNNNRTGQQYDRKLCEAGGCQSALFSEKINTPDSGVKNVLFYSFVILL